MSIETLRFWLDQALNHGPLNSTDYRNAQNALKSATHTQQPISANCVCPLPYRAKHPEEHIDTCPVVDEQPVVLSDQQIIDIVAIFNNPESPKVKCEECNGTGHIDVETDGYPGRCEECEGYGYYRMAVNQAERVRQVRLHVLSVAVPDREIGEDKLHALILRLAHACDCAAIVSCNSEDDKMLMLRIVEQVRENIVRHTQIKGFVEIWLAKEFPERYKLEPMDDNTRRGSDA